MITFSHILEELHATGRVFSLATEKDTLQQFKDCAGVYCFLHQTHQKLYVGSSHNLWRRLCDHMARGTRRSNTPLQELITATGLDTFHVAILAAYPPHHTITDKDLFEKEDVFLQKWPGDFLLNLHRRAGSPRGYKVSPEKRRAGALAGFWGRSHTPAVKHHLQKLHRGRGNPMWGKQKSPEFLAWMGLARRGQDNYMWRRGIAISVWTTDDSFVGDFPTIKQVVTTLGIAKETLKRHLVEQRPYYPRKSPVGYWFSKMMGPENPREG